MGKVFLITGASSGFGAELVKIVLANGDTAIATARDPSTLKFDNTNDKNFLAVTLDVTDQSSIDAAFNTAVMKFSRIDVVVNNAGYGVVGVFESISDKQTRQLFDVNFFGTVAVTKKAVQVMRDFNQPPGGVIQQNTSGFGQVGAPHFSMYCASKWAVEGFTEAAALEVKPEWGIKFTCVEPGSARTGWQDKSLVYGEDSSAAYDHMDVKKDLGQVLSGEQPGDPVKIAQAMYKLATMENPPPRALLGSDVIGGVMNKLEESKKNYEKHMDLAKNVDVD